MCVHVHQADLAAEERRALRPLEEALRAAVVCHRTVEQAETVGSTQMCVDQPQMLTRLHRRQHVLENRMDNCQRAVPYTSRGVARMQEVTYATALFEKRVAGKHAIHEKQTLKISLHGLGPPLEAESFMGAPDRAQRARQCP